MQNGCTSAVEATINKTPVIQYNNFQKISYKISPYNLGIQINNLDELLLEVNSLFKNIKTKDQKKVNKDIPSIIHDKIYLDKNELAAEKIVKLWESFEDKSISEFSNLKKYNLILKFTKVRKMIGKFKRNLIHNKFKINEDEKFPIFKNDDIQERVKKLQHILGIEKINCEILSDRTILINNK